MGIKDAWNDFKVPIKQTRKNILYTLDDYATDRREQQIEKEIEKSRQTNCDDFYCLITDFSDQLHSITKNSPCITLKTKQGNRIFTFGATGFRIQDSNPSEALYAFYSDLDGIPTTESANTNNEKNLGIILAIICGVAGVIFSKYLFLGTAFFLIGAFFPIPHVNIEFPFKDDNTGQYSCSYMLQHVPTKEWSMLLPYLNHGLNSAISYNKQRVEELLDDDAKIEINYLMWLQQALCKAYNL